MTRLLMAFALTVLVACTTSAPAAAGPNAGGTMIAHDANLLLSATDGEVSLCGQGTVPPDCQAADTRLDGAGNLGGDQAVFLVYAAFPPSGTPRLMGVTWGVFYDAGNVILSHYGKCGDFELNDDGWPAPGKGSSVTWDVPQTASLVPVYWFAAYTYGNSGTFDLGPNPSQGGVFGDDGIPAVLDPIAAYGKLGFDMPGSLPCPDVTPGACCAPDGSCTVTTEDGCVPPSVWHHEWASSCAPNPCPQLGACCHPNTGSCTLVMQVDCIAPSVWQGANTSCIPSPCPPPPGACCHPGGGCVLTTAADCTWPNVWHSEWASCDPNPCPQPGACCAADGSCTIRLQSECVGVWMGPDTSCTPNPCPQPQGACCHPDGSCVMTTAAECTSPNVWHSEWASCDANPCPPPNGACCFPDGSCTFVPQAQCTGQWLGYGTNCTPNPCPQPPVLGACCAWTGGCTLTYESACPPPSTWHAGWSSCTPNPCPEPSIGPNAGGTLIVHDAAMLVSATDGSASICGQGTIIQHCPEADTEIDGSTSADPSIFKVYAAFMPGFPPRLMGVTWSVTYDPARIILSDHGRCGDFELNDNGWPATGTGSSVTWDQAQTSELVPVYWFAGYVNGGPASFNLGPNPSQGGYFGDDAVPSHLDAIAAYGKIGFDQPGELACPQPLQFGACCQGDGSCRITTVDGCPPPGVWHSEWTGCQPNPCPPPPPPTGACCHPDGTCVLIFEVDCTPPNIWHSNWTSCDPNPCPQPGACCAPDGTCTFTLQSQCTGTWLGPGTSCTPNPCPPPNGACCFPDGSCTFVSQAQCTGQWLGYGTNCTPNPCPQPPALGACCTWNGACTLTYENGCAAPSTWHGEWTSCAPNPCPEPSIGPNAGGTLILHDASLLVSATDGSSSICTLGSLLEHCPGADTEIDGSSSADPSIFKVYAAFLPGFPPRLMGVTWGVSYDPARIVLSDYGHCGDFELNDQGWPASGTGATVTWDQVQQSEMVQVYWFAGYSNGGAATLTLAPNPTQGGYFGDDAVPAHLDAIAGFGKLGFDTPGELVCPQPIEVGACCQPADGSCMLTTAEGCPAPGVWHPEWTNCHPNPCPVPPPPTGACCHPDGACVVTVQADCTSPNVWHSNWPSCDPNPCPQPGACCAADGSCTVGLQSQCTGVWMGPNTSCTPNPCPQPLGACCHPDGSCVMTTQAECTSPNVWHSNWPSCDPNPCPQPGACCASDGTCTTTFQSQCNGIWIGPNTSCEPNPCPRPGACCAVDGACTITLEALCNGSWQGPDTGCVPNPCPQPGACCRPDGSCTVTLQPECTGVWMGPGTNCTPNLCPQPQGACCDPSGACFLTTQAGCTWPNIWQGPDTNCNPNPCPQPGACCTADGGCAIALESQCDGMWMGANTSCTPDPCPPPGACCAPNGTCTITLQALCNGNWLGPDTGCDPNPCPQPPAGACCYPDGHCVFTIQADCPTGDWHINVPCSPNPCQPSVTGACCIGTICTITTEAGCAGQWTGPGTTCTPNPCCRVAPPYRPLASHEDKAARALGPAPTVLAPSTRTICPGSTLKSNDDGSYENGYAWAYDGVTTPYYGAWAEGFYLESNYNGVCGVKFALTQIGAQECWLMDVYVWQGSAGNPEAVVCMTSGVYPGAIGMWPTVTLHDIDIPDCCVSGQYFVGWWGNWVGTGNGWYIASDENGFAGGLPRTNIAPGIGYPTGWNHPNVVSTFAGCQDLGIGVYEAVVVCGTPTERMSWGRLKALYR